MIGKVLSGSVERDAAKNGLAYNEFAIGSASRELVAVGYISPISNTTSCPTLGRTMGVIEHNEPRGRVRLKMNSVLQKSSSKYYPIPD